jgi:hypothetical protein
MGKFRIKLATVIGAVFLATVSLPATMAVAEVSASPAVQAVQPTASGCHGAYYVTCVTVNGSGLHITSMVGSFQNNTHNGFLNIHIELTGPKGLIKNCPQVSDVYVGQTITCTWSPNDNRAAGNYCSTTWQNNGGGNFTNLGEACVDVHS